MDDVPKHDIHEAAARPLRRGRVAAWLVFLGMAGTTMAFQTYHSLHNGQMPWPLAYLYGIVPLGISIGVLIFAAVWPSKAGRAGAYLITAGAMYMSASATGAVTLHASSPHAELLFGVLLDGAALLAIRFIFDGPTAGQAVAAVGQKIAELTAEADAERSAREQAEGAHRAAESDLRARAGAEIEKLSTAHASVQRELESARRDAAEALDRAEALKAKLDAGSAQKKRVKAPASGRPAAATTGDADPTNELRAVMELRANPDLRRPRMGGELARRLGIGASTGRRLHGALVKDGALSEYAESLIEPLGERSQ